MKKILFSLIFIGQILCFAVITKETPKKLEAFIDRNIGIENFFDGTNRDSKEITVKKTKDFVYFAFDIYKTVSMTTGIQFDQNNKAHHLRLGEQKYALSLKIEEVVNIDTGLKNSIIIFVFAREN